MTAAYQPELPGIPRGRSQAELEADRRPKPARQPSALEQRQARGQQARARRHSLLTRSEDFDTENEIPTEDFGMHFDVPPPWAAYHTAARSAWRKYGKETEVPIVGIHTPQDTVQATRFHEAREVPESRQNPLFHGMTGDLPRVFHEERPGRMRMTSATTAERGPNEHHYTVVDGNHRITSALSRGEMFQPARVLGPENEQDVVEHTERIHEHKANAFARTMVDPVERIFDEGSAHDTWGSQSGGAMGTETMRRMAQRRPQS